jgi:cytosine/adenosine deaminase-related metal-dependent hydrolase
MPYLSAPIIFPITSPPAYNSVLAVNDNGIIEGIYRLDELQETKIEIVHYNGILCPGFVNTHGHLELSWAKGLIDESCGLDAFVRQLENHRKSVSESKVSDAIQLAASEMLQSGVVATADIANGNQTLDFKSNTKQYFHTFVEVFGSNPSFANAIFEKALLLKKQFAEHDSLNKVSIAPHATYSLSEELFKLISETENPNLLSIHHQENLDENLFFYNGSGPIADRRKAFNPDVQPFFGTGKRPMESIAAYFHPDQKLLLVHNSVSEQQDIDFVQHFFNQPYWCFCPNANLFIENRLPDIELFRANNCKITLGTDSLASNHQLSIFEEIKTLQFRFPNIPLSELLSWGTINGASFLGLEKQLGSFEKGKSPGVVLLENIDNQSLKLTPESTSRLLIPAYK